MLLILVQTAFLNSWEFLLQTRCCRSGSNMEEAQQVSLQWRCFLTLAISWFQNCQSWLGVTSAGFPFHWWSRSLWHFTMFSFHHFYKSLIWEITSLPSHIFVSDLMPKYHCIRTLRTPSSSNKTNWTCTWMSLDKVTEKSAMINTEAKKWHLHKIAKQYRENYSKHCTKKISKETNRVQTSGHATICFKDADPKTGQREAGKASDTIEKKTRSSQGRSWQPVGWKTNQNMTTPNEKAKEDVV